MDKRRTARYKRRIQLRFWSQDDRNPRKGFTQNVSVSGMFVSTNAPYKPGTRVFLEVPYGQEKLVLQAEVRYAARVDPALQKVKPSGMGVRLLRVDEVMSEVLKIKSAGVVEVEEKPESAAEVAIEEVSDLEGSVFPIIFETAHDLANSYERDIKYGGLFIASQEPAEKDDMVVLEFRFGWDTEQVVQVQAQVVKKFASAEGSLAGEAVSGMGVAFSDPSDVMSQFGNVFSALDQSHSQNRGDD
jgi:Tfp pilus assembly protein PilZ